METLRSIVSEEIDIDTYFNIHWDSLDKCEDTLKGLDYKAHFILDVKIVMSKAAEYDNETKFVRKQLKEVKREE